jgi:signal peptidase I
MGLRRLLLLGGAAGLVAIGRRMVGCARVEVAGASMTPALHAGDRLLVVRTRRLRVGDLVVLPDPRDPDRALVKRLAAEPGGRVSCGDLVLEAGEGEVIVLGDNPAASTDSRDLGPLPVGSVVGKAVYRYHPPERAGRLSAQRGGATPP